MRTISDDYRKQMTYEHENDETWGTSGPMHIGPVEFCIGRSNSKSVLDYGCGKGLLGRKVQNEIPGIEWHDYDPAVKGKRKTPNRCDMVTCTDVMEHVEEQYVDSVLEHIASLATKCVFLYIACSKAGKILSDGRNAHITQKPIDWWEEKIERFFPDTKKIYRKERAGVRGGGSDKKDIALAAEIYWPGAFNRNG